MATDNIDPETSAQALLETRALAMETFKKALGDSVKAHFAAQERSNPAYYEIDEDINLKDLKTDEVQMLAFGKVFEVLEQFYDSGSDSTWQENKEAIKRELKDQLTGEFSGQLQVFADSFEEDVDEIIEELLEDDDLSHQELGIDPYNMNYRFKGVMAAHSSMGVIRLDPANGDYLFDSLNLFRIGIDDYLLAASKAIDEALDEETGALDDVLVDQWGLSGVDLDDAEDKRSWSEHYASIVKIALEGFTHRTGLTLRGFAEPAVADVTDLIGMALDQSGHAELYLHVTIGSETVKDFSYPANRHDLASSKAFLARVESGYLATDTEPCTGAPYSTALLSSIEVLADGFSVLKASPESNTEDDIRLTVGDDVYGRLYERAIIKRRQAEGGNAEATLDIEVESDRQCLKDCLRIIEKAPLWASKLAIQRIALLDIAPVRDLIDDSSGPESNKQTALEIIRALQVTRDDSKLTNDLRLLAALGPDLDTRDNNRLTAFDWACRRGMPLDIVQLLASPTILRALSDANADQEKNALSLCIQGLKVISRATHQDKDIQKNRALEVAHWLIGQGAAIPAGMFRPPSGLPFEDLMSIENGPLFKAVMDRVEDQSTQTVSSSIFDDLLLRACKIGQSATVLALLEKGVDAVRAGAEQAVISKQATIDPSSLSQRQLSQNLTNVLDILRSDRAKKAAIEALRGLGLSLSASVSP